MVKARWPLSYEATPITSAPTPGAPAANSASGDEPPGPLLPIEATITTPFFASRAVACADGYSGHWRAAPRLWLMTCMPSASACSSAEMMMSEVVLPAQPNTR